MRETRSRAAAEAAARIASRTATSDKCIVNVIKGQIQEPQASQSPSLLHDFVDTNSNTTHETEQVQSGKEDGELDLEEGEMIGDVANHGTSPNNKETEEIPFNVPCAPQQSLRKSQSTQLDSDSNHNHLQNVSIQRQAVDTELNESKLKPRRYQRYEKLPSPIGIFACFQTKLDADKAEDHIAPVIATHVTETNIKESVQEADSGSSSQNRVEVIPAAVEDSKYELRRRSRSRARSPAIQNGSCKSPAARFESPLRARQERFPREPSRSRSQTGTNLRRGRQPTYDISGRRPRPYLPLKYTREEERDRRRSQSRSNRPNVGRSSDKGSAGNPRSPPPFTHGQRRRSRSPPFARGEGRRLPRSPLPIHIVEHKRSRSPPPFSREEYGMVRTATHVPREGRSSAISQSRPYIPLRVDPFSSPDAGGISRPMAISEGDWKFELRKSGRFICRCNAVASTLPISTKLPLQLDIVQLPHLARYQDFLLSERRDIKRIVYETSPQTAADKNGYEEIVNYLLRGRNGISRAGAAMELDPIGLKLFFLPPGQAARSLGYKGNNMIAVMRTKQM